jgi:hypothetical protein
MQHASFRVDEAHLSATRALAPAKSARIAPEDLQALICVALWTVWDGLHELPHCTVTVV